MPNRIRPLRRTGSTGVPVVANMLDGEIAINSFDKKIYMRVGSNLVEVANASSGDWNTLANKPTNFVYNEASTKIRVSQNNGTLSNDAFSNRFFEALENGSNGFPGYGFHKGGQYGWFLYAQVDGFYGRRNDGQDMRLWSDGMGGDRNFSGNINGYGSAKFKSFDGNADIAAVEMGSGWNNGTDRVGYVLNRNAGSPLRIAGRNGTISFGVGETVAQSVLNSEMSVVGNNAGFNFQDRGGVSNWTLYSTGNVTYLWNNAVGNIYSFTTSGRFYASQVRVGDQFIQGDSGSYGWQLLWNAIAPGVGASEYINNRQGGGGGHMFATRQNDTQTPVQHHHLLSNGRMNVRTAAGNWHNQGRVFVQSVDPGANAEDGDLWIW